jgi:hypothetical protein
MALMSTYLVLLLLYVAPPALVSLLQILNFDAASIERLSWFGITSPFSALFSLPLDANLKRPFDETPANVGNPVIVAGYLAFSTCLLAVSTVAMVARLRSRRGLSE